MRSVGFTLRGLLAIVAAVAVSLAAAGSASAAFGLINKWGSYGNANGQFIRPSSVAVDPSGNVYVADTDPGSSTNGSPSNRVQKFDHDGNFISSWGGTGTSEGKFMGPAGIALDNAGNVYVVDVRNHRIQVFTISGQFQRMFGYGVSDGATAAVQVCTSNCHAGLAGNGDGQHNHPSGIAIGPNGTLFIGEFAGMSVQQVTTNGTYISRASTSGTASGVSIGPNNVVYVSNYGGPIAVNTYDLNLNPLGGFGANDDGSADSHFTQVPDVVASPGGTIYVADRLGFRVQLFDLTGTFKSKFDTTSFGTPYGLALDCRGNIFIANGGDAVAEFGEQGLPFVPCVGGGGGGTADSTAPLISQVRVSNKTFAVDANAASARRAKKIPRGTSFSYTLSEAATVTFAIDRKTTGRKSGKRCAKKTKRNAKRKKCTRYVKAGSFSQASKSGANKKSFSGKIKGKRLRPAPYRATLTAADAARNVSKAVTASFRVVRATKRKR